MEPISRRLFLVGSVAVVVGACSDDQPASSPPATTGPDTAAPTVPAVDEPGETDAATSVETIAPEPTTVAPIPATPIELPGDPFTLGVASGDPTTRSVVLWTRLAPDPANGGGMAADDVDVVWEVSGDPAFAELVATGLSTAERQYGHSVHVEVQFDDDVVAQQGTLHYRFRVGQFTSPMGITRVVPSPATDLTECSFVSASCQHYEAGYYIAHREIAQRQPDFVVWLGDYIYEGGAGTIGEGDRVRTHGTPEVSSLDEYRNRYALYKGDADLQAAHAACPWLVTWDDHEVENNYAGLIPQDAQDASAFAQRRHDAYQAWWEHQPVALPPPVLGQDYPIYRSFDWGGLLNIVLLDGRQYRTDQACGGATLNLDPACPETFDESRTMLGDAQEQWLFDVLEASTSTWNVIAQQTIFGDVTLGSAVLNYDQWDGYPLQRNRIVDRLATDGIENVVVLTGDIHYAGVGTVRSGGRGTGTPVGTEFVATSISSGGRVDPAVTEVVKAIDDILDVELEHRGYIWHSVQAPAWRAQYRMVDTVKALESALFQHAVYQVDAGTNMVRQAEGMARD